VGIFRRSIVMEDVKVGDIVTSEGDTFAVKYTQGNPAGRKDALLVRQVLYKTVVLDVGQTQARYSDVLKWRDEEGLTLVHRHVYAAGETLLNFDGSEDTLVELVDGGKSAVTRFKRRRTPIWSVALANLAAWTAQ
jgi:hypothetical protein